MVNRPESKASGSAGDPALALQQILENLRKPLREILERFLHEAKVRGAVHLLGQGYLTLAEVELEGMVYILSKAPGKFKVALSACEKEVALLAADGLSNREIAARLGKKMATVCAHMQSIFKKLDIRSRALLGQYKQLLS